MLSWKDSKFIRKIQFAFLLIAGISTLIVLNNFYQLTQIENSKDQIFSEFIKPQKELDKIYTDFNILQYDLLKFSIAMFESDLDKNIEDVKIIKSSIDSSFDRLSKIVVEPAMKKNLKEAQEIWTNYKNVVADAILSAGFTKNYEMAAVVSVTSGNEVGSLLKSKFEVIQKDIIKKSELLNSDIDNNINNAQLFLYIGMILGTTVFLFSVFKIAPILSGPINRIKVILGGFAAGDFEQDIKVESKDEFGELALALNQVQDMQKEKIQAAIEISSGKMVDIKAASDKDKLAIALNTMVSTLKDLIKEMALLTNAATKGELSIKGDCNKFEGDYRKIVEGVNATTEAILYPIREGSKTLSLMAQGDLSAKVEGHFQGDHLLIINSINDLGESLSNVLGEVIEMIQSTSTVSSQISSSTEEMAAGAAEQSQQASEVAAAVEEMTCTILESTKNATSASEASRLAGEIAQEGGKVVLETIDGMTRIAKVVERSAETVQKLGKSSDEIGEIIQVIDDIADQTNLLALNAAIEAARAGEQGRGFAVVADEVRKLAERTTKATKEIASMIKQIQKDTEGAVNSMQEGKKHVEEGTKLAEKSGKSLNEIIDGSQKVVDIITQVAAASEQQSTTSEQISKSIDSINNVTHETSEGIHQIAKSAEDLNRLTTSLESLIQRFKISSSSNNTLKSNLSVKENGTIVY